MPVSENNSFLYLRVLSELPESPVNVVLLKLYSKMEQFLLPMAFFQQINF